MFHNLRVGTPTRSILAVTLVTAAALAGWHSGAHAAKSTECAKVGICYCVNDDLKPTIAARVERFRQVIADQRKAGKAVGYLSVPLTSTGGGNYNVNKEVAESAKAAIEKRFGADFMYVLNPATPDSNLPNGGGADYTYTNSGGFHLWEGLNGNGTPIGAEPTEGIVRERFTFRRSIVRRGHAVPTQIRLVDAIVGVAVGAKRAGVYPEIGHGTGQPARRSAGRVVDQLGE